LSFGDLSSIASNMGTEVRSLDLLPSTVFSFSAARDLLRFFKQMISYRVFCSGLTYGQPKRWFYDVGSSVGYKVAQNPCSYEYVRYRVDYSIPQIDMALSRLTCSGPPGARVYDDPLRQHIRTR